MEKTMWCVCAVLGILLTACTGQPAKNTSENDSTAVAAAEVVDSFIRINAFFTLTEESERAIFEQMCQSFTEVSKQDEGLIGMDIMKSVTDPNKYVFVETLATEEATQNHINKYSESFASDFEKMAIRDVKEMSQPSEDQGKGWYINILASIDPANLEKLIPMMTTMSLNSQAEERCNGYEFFVSILDNSRIFLYEDWPDKDASDFHRATDNFQHNFPPIRELFTEFKVDRLYR